MDRAHVDVRHAVFKFSKSEEDAESIPWVGYGLSSAKLTNPGVGGEISEDPGDPKTISKAGKPIQLTGRELKVFLEESMKYAKSMRYTLVGANCFTPVYAGLLKAELMVIRELKACNRCLKNARFWQTITVPEESELDVYAKLEEKAMAIGSSVTNIAAGLKFLTDSNFGMGTSKLLSNRMLEVAFAIGGFCINPLVGIAASIPLLKDCVQSFVGYIKKQWIEQKVEVKQAVESTLERGSALMERFKEWKEDPFGIKADLEKAYEEEGMSLAS
jgi:hypothetical protein